MIRFFLLNAFIALYTIILCAWGFLLSLFDRKGTVIHAYAAVPWARGILWVCGIKLRVQGLGNVDPHQPRIYMTNHQSYFDIFALLAYVPVDFKFIVKQELMRIPILGFSMKRAGYIGIERDNPRKAIQSMNEAAKRIKEGVSVVIFPEGTRSVDGRLQPFKRGGFNLALKAGSDIVPVAIINSHRIVPKGSLRINRGSFDLRIGPPIPVGGYTRKNIDRLMKRVWEDMAHMLDQGRGDPDTDNAPAGGTSHGR